MVICPECGKDVVDAKFCSNCGASLDAPVEEVVEDNDPVEVVVTPVGEVDSDVIDVKVKDESPDEEIGANVVKKSKFCTNCGMEVNLDTVFCPQCGYKFVRENVDQQTKFCQGCGKKININAEICPHCGVRVANVTSKGEKNVLLSAILSIIFPGLGQIYLGLNRKGISFIIAYIISAILIMLLIGFVLVLVVWVWALIDSIRSTEAINRGEYVEDKLF